MQAGKLKKRLTIQSLPDVPERNSDGSEKVDDSQWQDLATVWASVEPISGKEFFAAQEIVAEITHRIRLRYYAGLTPKMRLKLNDRIFDMQRILNVEERNRELEILARELV
jgi:SPP1 family predicted phage head-tail adaptor